MYFIFSVQAQKLQIYKKNCICIQSKLTKNICILYFPKIIETHSHKIKLKQVYVFYIFSPNGSSLHRQRFSGSHPSLSSRLMMIMIMIMIMLMMSMIMTMLIIIRMMIMIMMKLLNDDVCLFVVHQSYMIMIINFWKHWVEYFQVLLSLGFFKIYFRKYF